MDHNDDDKCSTLEKLLQGNTIRVQRFSKFEAVKFIFHSVIILKKKKGHLTREYQCVHTVHVER